MNSSYARRATVILLGIFVCMGASSEGCEGRDRGGDGGPDGALLMGGGQLDGLTFERSLATCDDPRGVVETLKSDNYVLSFDGDTATIVRTPSSGGCERTITLYLSDVSGGTITWDATDIFDDGDCSNLGDDFPMSGTSDYTQQGRVLHLTTDGNCDAYYEVD